MPVKITPTGGYALKTRVRLQIPGSCLGPRKTYRANDAANCYGKRIEDIYHRIQPR